MNNRKSNLIEISCIFLGTIFILGIFFLWTIYPKITNNLNASIKITAPIHSVRVNYYNPEFEIIGDDNYPQKDFVTEEIISKDSKSLSAGPLIPASLNVCKFVGTINHSTILKYFDKWSRFK